MVLRGVSAKAFELRPESRLVSGRMFERGTNELIVGVGAQEQFADLDLDDKVIMQNGEWTVVGSFTTDGDLLEGQLLGEVDTVLASRRQNGIGRVQVKLECPEPFETLRKALNENPTLEMPSGRKLFTDVAPAISAVSSPPSPICSAQLSE